MLDELQASPFKFIINDLKKIIQNDLFEKEEAKIKRNTKTLAQITNFNEFFTLILNSNWISRLCLVFKELNNNIQQKNHDQTILPSTPLQTFNRKQLLIPPLKQTEFTPSTKQSRVLLNSSIKYLMEGLIQNLQKFSEIKQNSKRIKQLIQQLKDCFQISQFSEFDSDDISFQKIWKQLSSIDLQTKFNQLIPSLLIKKSCINQLFQHIQTIYKYMQVIKTTTDDIFNMIDQKQLDSIENDSAITSLIESITVKSNALSQQKSLLTEMLRESSQSNIDISVNQYRSQVVLRLGIRQYSQQQDTAFLDQQYKISSKSVKGTKKLIRSQMNYNIQHLQTQTPIQRKQIQIKKSEIGCSKCQIF